jgi:hypothetical protein
MTTQFFTLSASLAKGVDIGEDTTYLLGVPPEALVKAIDIDAEKKK